MRWFINRWTEPIQATRATLLLFVMLGMVGGTICGISLGVTIVTRMADADGVHIYFEYTHDE